MKKAVLLTLGGILILVGCNKITPPDYKPYAKEDYAGNPYKLWVHWDPPTTGTPAVFYHLNVHHHGGRHIEFIAVDGPFCPITVVPGDSIRFQVTGVDSLGRRGEPSDMSDWYFVPKKKIDDDPELREWAPGKVGGNDW